MPCDTSATAGTTTAPITTRPLPRLELAIRWTLAIGIAYQVVQRFTYTGYAMSEYARSLWFVTHRHGFVREAVWIESTPAGDLAIVLLESADLAASMFGLATSDDPFDVWFRAHLQMVHGIDLAAGMTLPEPVLDYRAGAGVGADA